MGDGLCFVKQEWIKAYKKRILVTMVTVLFTHRDCLAHDNGDDNPERSARLSSILKELEKPVYAALQRKEAPLALVEQIGRLHDLSYIRKILETVPDDGYIRLDPETALSKGSANAALRAAGAVVAAIDAVMKGDAVNAFCAIRPPGHHAGSANSSGFCLFNNIAIGAEHALAVHGLQRIAIVDFDVHHGNGTQEWAEKKKEILFFSSHQWPLWPGSGRVKDCGPLGNITNIPLPPGTDGAKFREKITKRVFPALDNFAPELVLISAGFDAHRDDPLASINLVEDDYFWITAELCRLAQKHCQGRIVSVLEGGYDLVALAASVGAHVRGLIAAAA